MRWIVQIDAFYGSWSNPVALPPPDVNSSYRRSQPALPQYSQRFGLRQLVKAIHKLTRNFTKEVSVTWCDFVDRNSCLDANPS